VLTVLYIHNPYLPTHLCTASEVSGDTFIVQADFSTHPPLWQSQKKEYGDDKVRSEAFLMSYRDKMRGASMIEVTRVYQEA